MIGYIIFDTYCGFVTDSITNGIIDTIIPNVTINDANKSKKKYIFLNVYLITKYDTTKVKGTEKFVKIGCNVAGVLFAE